MKNSVLINRIKGLFTRQKRKSPTVVHQEVWTLKVKGEITEIKRLDIDKSGKNSSFLLYGTIRVDSYQLDGADFEVPEFLSFKGKEKDFKEKTEQSLVVGEKVDLKFVGVEIPQERFVFK